MRALSGSPIMLSKRILFLQVLLFVVVAVRAQVAIQVVEAVTGAPVPYAHIAWQPLGGGQGQLVVSTPDGKAELPLGPELLAKGVVVRISFLGNVTIVDTLRSNTPRTYRMERASVGLQEVVVTGQYAPGAPEKAVHKVRVLDETQFKRMAANNLGDALRNELNIRLSQDNVLGTSLSMQGLGGQNVKVLVDGVPVVGRQDGNIDLAQLDLTGVERAEIIEGPLSVNYGTNALAGTINLITRKSVASPFALKASVYAEHIGRLNTTLSGGGKWGRHDLLITAGRNFFGGWDPDQQGVPSFEPAPADMTRYQQWKPREQYFGRVGYGIRLGDWRLNYKGEVMDDHIINRGRPRAPYYETAFDEEYVTLRLDNAVFAERRFSGGRSVNLLAAHNRYTRTRNTWFRDLTDLDAILITAEGMQDTSRFTLTNLRGTFAVAPDSARLRYEVGYDLNLETGSGDRIAEGGEEIGDYAVFASLEYLPTARITVRPGLRAAYNTRYGAPVIPSVNVRWTLTDAFTLRASYAQGFRAPSLKELYLYFVDVNHDIVGNPDLNAERSHSMNAALSYRHAKDKGVYRSELGLFYNAIEDLITLAQVSTTTYTYINVGRLHTAGGTIGSSWDNGHWVVSVGGGLTARLDEMAMEHDEPWLLSPEARASLTHQWMKTGWSISMFWKYQGEVSAYTFENDGEVGRSFIGDYNMADVNVTKRFWEGRSSVSLGCKDLFDVQNVQATMAAGAHSGGGVSVPMTTGRTYFLRLELDLKKRK